MMSISSNNYYTIAKSCKHEERSFKSSIQKIKKKTVFGQICSDGMMWELFIDDLDPN